MEKDVAKVLISEEELKQICKRHGEQITKDYQGKKLLVVSVLKGAVVFMADLLREIKCDCAIDFIAVSSYSGTKTTGVVKFKKMVANITWGESIRRCLVISGAL